MTPALTLGQLIEAFVAHTAAAVQRGTTAAGTLVYYRYQLNHLRRARDPAGVPLVDRVAASLTGVDLAGIPPTPHCTSVTKRLFKWGRLPDPLFDVRTPPTGQRTRVVEPDEFRRLRRACGFELRRVVWFLSQTGARPGELRQLRWEQVFEAERVVRLKKFKAKDRRKDGVRVRVIPMSEAAARVLGYWRRARQARPGELVFRNSKGRPWTCQALTLAVRRARVRAGLDPEGERLVAYTMRHTFATRAVEHGVQETALADMLGHTTLSTTRRYLHRKPSDLVKALDVAMGARPRKAG